MTFCPTILSSINFPPFAISQHQVLPPNNQFRLPIGWLPIQTITGVLYPVKQLCH